MTSISNQVALVDESGKFSMDVLSEWSGALNEQIGQLRDHWTHVSRAHVVPWQKAPKNTWSIRIQRSLDESGALGYHTDENNQPISFVLAQSVEETSVTVSHELLEMLADPWGNKMHGARLPAGVEKQYKKLHLKTINSHVQYLYEVCDPPEAASYLVGDVPVSDFLLPDWYHSNPQARDAYSYIGTCRKPREVADGGYVSFMVPTTREWFQVFNFGSLQLKDIGRFDRSKFGSLRSFTDHFARRAQERS